MEKGLTDDETIARYNKAIQANPKRAISYYFRGRAWERKGDYVRAIEDHTQCIELGSKSAPVFLSRGNCFAKLGNYDRALSDFDKAILLNPPFAHAYLLRGEVYEKKGDRERALADFGIALQLSQTDDHRATILAKLIGLNKGVKKRTDQDLSRGDFRAFFSGIVLMLLCGVIVMLFLHIGRNMVVLATQGIETVATITDYRQHRCGRRHRRICHDHTLVAPGVGTFEIDLGRPYSIGSRIYVTYEPGKVGNHRAGERPTLATLGGLEWFGFLLAAGAIVFFGFAFFQVVVATGIKNLALRWSVGGVVLVGVIAFFVWIHGALA